MQILSHSNCSTNSLLAKLAVTLSCLSCLVGRTLSFTASGQRRRVGGKTGTNGNLGFPSTTPTLLRSTTEDVYTIQIPMSDTGGGHRASANPLSDAFEDVYCDIDGIHAVFIPDQRVRNYQFLEGVIASTDFGFCVNEFKDAEHGGVGLVVNSHPDETPVIPISGLLVETATHQLDEGESMMNDMMTDISEFDFALEDETFKVRNWDGKKGYSDYIAQGLKYKKMEDPNVVMLFDSPSSCSDAFSFYNKNKFVFHDWPPPPKTGGKNVLGPCRYSLMNGATYPVFLKGGTPPEGLLEHWAAAVPNFQPPTYVNKIADNESVYAYLPVEQIRQHVNDPHVHYHLVGKDAIHKMTQKTTALLSDTKTVRPCVVKTTHSMGSKGIFIINNDDDEAEFEKFLEDSGRPPYLVTDFVDIARNIACHFFMHPDGSIVWFGSNENHREADGSFSSDSYLIMEHQDKLKELQLPFVKEVVQYCLGLGFFGFCGVDVLFDSQDRGYLVDINPRVTGSCPALMTLKRLQDAYGFSVGLFRRTGNTCFHGSPTELMEQVAAYNEEHEGKSRIVIHSMFQTPGRWHTRINIGVYGTNLDECKNVLNSFAKDMPL